MYAPPSLVFGITSHSSAPAETVAALYVIELKTNKVSKFACSEGMVDPSWSPDGHYLAAITADFDKLMPFDFARRQWAPVAQGTLLKGVAWPRDGKTLYFQDLLDKGAPVDRLNISGRNRAKVPGCGRVLEAGFVRCTLMGLDTNDSPLLQLTRSWADV